MSDPRERTSAETLHWQITVGARRPADDAAGRMMVAAARQAGFADVEGIRATRLYQVAGRLGEAEACCLADELFADGVIESAEASTTIAWPRNTDAFVEVHRLPGVMDPVAMSAESAARELLVQRFGAAEDVVRQVRTGWRYAVEGGLSLPALERLAREVLSNACIERFFVRGAGREDMLPQAFAQAPAHPFQVVRVTLADLDDDALARLSRQGHLFLSVEEMRAIRDHFAGLGRDPTDIELETVAQTWSEHCVHKTLKSAVRYEGRAFGREGADGATVTRRYDNLLKDTIVAATQTLDRPWCLSVFVDNAGIISLDERHGVAFKVETHNHPSAIEPYGGAATGAGGCIRDILGCGLGAKPIANTDVFCLARPDFAAERVPTGVLRPARVLQGVVAGVRDYGNRMGIPTVAGGLYFDDRYLANPLVFCGCVGLIPRDRIEKAPQVGDHVVVVGGRTGRDGIGGATFSSAELTDAHADEFAHAVQIGNAIEEKKVLDGLLRARDHADGCLYHAVTDCGAGGLSSAVGEMGETLGAAVDLERVPLKYSGLRYNEIWLSEAQERMVFAVPEENLARLVAVFATEGVEALAIGRFTGDGRIVLRYEGTTVGDLACEFLHDGLPQRERSARWSHPAPNLLPTPTTEEPADPGEALCARLASLNVCSREAIIRQYDHEVQGGSVIKPMVGRGEGPSDAAVVQPLPDAMLGIALGKGLCPQLSDEDPYWMAVEAIDEAIRNVICVGADVDRIAILDNFCWGGCDDPESMGALVRACQGCHDAALAYGTPFISGKDSLNNQFRLSADEARQLELPERIAIPPTLLISALGIVEDFRRCSTADLKHDGHALVWARVDLRAVGCEAGARLHRAVATLIARGAVAACHDVSDGGLLVAVAEMCIGGRRGAIVDLAGDAAAAAHLACGASAVAGESGYVLEVRDGFDLGDLEHVAQVRRIGAVCDDASMTIRSGAESVVAVERLDAAWRSGLAMVEGA